MRRGVRSFPAIILAAVALAVPASPAAAITLGQLAASPNGCASNTDWVEPAVSSGVVPYVVPNGYGTITSWSTRAFGSPGDLGLKVFRPTSTALTYSAVAHDGPHTLSSPGVNTFPVNIRVQPGDLIGLHVGDLGATCSEIIGSDPDYHFPDDLLDGQQGGPFTAINDRRLDITAEVAPTVTGQRAAALKKCKKRHSKRARRKCRRKANLLPS